MREYKPCCLDSAALAQLCPPDMGLLLRSCDCRPSASASGRACSLILVGAHDAVTLVKRRGNVEMTVPAERMQDAPHMHQRLISELAYVAGEAPAASLFTSERGGVGELSSLLLWLHGYKQCRPRVRFAAKFPASYAVGLAVQFNRWHTLLRLLQSCQA